MNHLSTAQLSSYLQITKRTVQRRAVSEGWSHITTKGLGGNRRLFVFATLPTTIKNTVVAQIIAKHEQYGLEYCADKPAEKVLNIDKNPFIVAKKTKDQDWLTQHIFAEQSSQPLDTIELNKTYIKVGLLELAHLYVLNFSLGKIKGYDKFCQLYNDRQLVLKAAIYQVVFRVSRITLLRWEKQLKQAQLQQTDKQSGLLNVNNKQTMLIDKDLIEIAQELLITSPNLSAKNLKQYFSTIFPGRKTPSQTQLSSWLELQKSLTQ